MEKWKHSFIWTNSEENRHIHQEIGESWAMLYNPRWGSDMVKSRYIRRYLQIYDIAWLSKISWWLITCISSTKTELLTILSELDHSNIWSSTNSMGIHHGSQSCASGQDKFWFWNFNFEDVRNIDTKMLKYARDACIGINKFRLYHIYQIVYI